MATATSVARARTNGCSYGAFEHPYVRASVGPVAFVGARHRHEAPAHCARTDVRMSVPTVLTFVFDDERGSHPYRSGSRTEASREVTAGRCAALECRSVGRTIYLELVGTSKIA